MTTTATINQIQIGQTFETEYFGPKALVKRIDHNTFQITYTKIMRSAIIGNPPFPVQKQETRFLSMMEQVALNHAQRTAPTLINQFYVKG